MNQYYRRGSQSPIQAPYTVIGTPSRDWEPASEDFSLVTYQYASGRTESITISQETIHQFLADHWWEPAFDPDLQIPEGL